MASNNIDQIINLCKNRGFIFPGSEIYGGLANTWDYGPLGVELKNNIKRLWWKYFVTSNDNSVGLDGGILLNPMVWKASGHIDGFSDPLVDCKNCHTRHRADNLIDNKCPVCGKSDFTSPRDFNLMFKTHRGVIEDSGSVVYLRPETAQNEFVDFLNVQRSMRLKIPFGIGQIGKAFRNEITPGNFVFRTIEFEQMEHQFFCKDGDSLNYYNYYKQKAWDFYTKILKIDGSKLQFKDHEQLAHYAKAACDIEYLFPWGFGEICGTHHRGTFDLGNHTKFSGKPQEYTDPITNEKFIPTVIESSHGCDRVLLTCLCNAYNEEQIEGDTRIILKLANSLAPYKAAILPLQKKEQGELATKIYRNLCNLFPCTYDETASIGKRYRRQDEIGTPFCITVDFDTEKDNTVTIRDRDSMKQERIKIDDLGAYIGLRIL